MYLLPPLSLCRVVSWTMLCSLAPILISAQEYAPVNPAGVVRSMDDPAPSPLIPPRDPLAGEKRGQGFNLGVVIAAAYDSNIFLSSRNAESDFVGKFTPAIAYSRGDRDSQDGGYLNLAYRPTGVAYSRNSADNRLDHDAKAAVGFVGNKIALDYSIAYSRLGDATPDTGRQADRHLIDHVVRIAWVPREKLALEVAAGQSVAEYVDKVLLDSKEVFGEIALRYAYSPKTRLGLAFRSGRFEVDRMEPQEFQRLSGKIEWQPREKIRVNMALGAEHREYANGSSVTPVMEGRIDWSPSEKTSYFLSAYRREMASAYSPGENYRLTGASAGVSQKIGEKWTASLEAGAERAAYRRVEGAGGSVGDDTLWFVRPSVSYRFTEQLGLEIFYRVSSNHSSRPDLGYDQQGAGVLLEYKF